MQLTCSSDWRLHLKTVPWDRGCFLQWCPVGTCFVHFVGHQLGFRMAKLSLGLQRSSSSLGSFPTGSFSHYSSQLPLARSGPERKGSESTEDRSFSSYFPAPGSFPGAWTELHGCNLTAITKAEPCTLVLYLHTSASCGLTAESSQGDFQPLSMILRKGCSHPTNKLTLEISLPHTSCSLDFTAFVLLFVVLFCLAKKTAHIPTGLVLFKGLPILYVTGVTPSICCCYTKAMHCWAVQHVTFITDLTSSLWLFF